MTVWKESPAPTAAREAELGGLVRGGRMGVEDEPGGGGRVGDDDPGDAVYGHGGQHGRHRGHGNGGHPDESGSSAPLGNPGMRASLVSVGAS